MSEGTTTWVLPHEVHITAQTRRAAPLYPSQDGGWVQADATGQAMLVCNCGYATGWVSKDLIREQYEQHKAEAGPDWIPNEQLARSINHDVTCADWGFCLCARSLTPA